MLKGITVVINTLNEEKNLERVLLSVKWVDEIIVCDMHSTDNTVSIAKRLGAKVFYHKREDFVEPARNFAISKASNGWILVLDPDEEVPASLKDRLLEVAAKLEQINYVSIPRKNIIFGKWMKASMWWPDYNIRFFKKGTVNWTGKIHRPPTVTGEGIELPLDVQYAIVHYHYEGITQFLERMMRYTKVQAEELRKEEYIFDYRDLIKKPLSEFLSRFFANRGFEDGLHGLALSFLQAFSFFVMYLRVWEMEGCRQQSANLEQLKSLTDQSSNQIKYWFNYSNLSKNPFKRFFQKVKNKVN